MPLVQWILQNLDQTQRTTPVLLSQVQANDVIQIFFKPPYGVVFQSASQGEIWLTTQRPRASTSLYRGNAYAVVLANNSVSKNITLHIPDLRTTNTIGRNQLFFALEVEYDKLTAAQYFSATPTTAAEVLVVLLVKRNLVGRAQVPRRIPGLQTSPLLVR